MIIFFTAKDGDSLNTQQKQDWDCGSDHELLIAKFRLKLKKVGKTARPFRYDLNQLRGGLCGVRGPGVSLEGMMLKVKLHYFGHLIRRVDSLEKTLMLGGIGGQVEKGTTEDEMAGWHH